MIYLYFYLLIGLIFVILLNTIFYKNQLRALSKHPINPTFGIIWVGFWTIFFWPVLVILFIINIFDYLRNY